MRRWRSAVLMFPMRPLGWAAALEAVAEPADIWHGMWAGSLPALRRMRSRHGGRTIYDSRDVYMHSRTFATLEWPIRPILAELERRWAREVDQVITVNESYADLLALHLGVPRPPVVLNTPSRWTPPVPAPDLIRQITGIPPGTAVVLYQGQLISQRGIEQAMEAILDVPNSVLVLLGFGTWADRYRSLAAQPAYADKVVVLPAVPPSELLHLDGIGRRHGHGDPADVHEPRVHNAAEAVGGDRGRRARRGLRSAGMSSSVAGAGIGEACGPVVLPRSPDPATGATDRQDREALRYILALAASATTGKIEVATVLAVYAAACCVLPRRNMTRQAGQSRPCRLAMRGMERSRDGRAVDRLTDVTVRADPPARG